MDLAIGFVIMAGMMLYYGLVPTWHLLLLPLPVAPHRIVHGNRYVDVGTECEVTETSVPSSRL